MHTDKYLQINGFSVRYREEGRGDAVVLVHGIAGFLEEWEPAMEILSKNYRVIALDLPGHGLSDKPEIPYTLDFLTGFLKDFISVISPGRIYLAGHSLGGAICLNLVIKYPSLVKKLMVLNSVFIKIPFSLRFFSPGFFQKINIPVPLSIVRLITRQIFYNNSTRSRNWLNHAYSYINKPGALRTMFSIFHEFMTLRGPNKELVNTFLHGLSQVEVPVLIVYSGKDRVISNKNSLLLHKHINNSMIRKVQNCGHELQYECCEEFCSIASGFFNA